MKFSDKVIAEVERLFHNEEYTKMAKDGNASLIRLIDEERSSFPSKFVLDTIAQNGNNAATIIKETIKQKVEGIELYHDWHAEIERIRNNGQTQITYSAEFIEKVAKVFGEDSEITKNAKRNFNIGRDLDENRSHWPLKSMKEMLDSPSQEEALDKLKEKAETTQAVRELYALINEEYSNFLASQSQPS